MNKEYVYLVFYLDHNLPAYPVYHEPIEYRCKLKIKDVFQYYEMKSWLEKRLKQNDVIITGFTLLREEVY